MKLNKRIKEWLRQKLSKWLIDDTIQQHKIIQVPSETVVINSTHMIDREVLELNPEEQRSVITEINRQMRENLMQEIVKGDLIEQSSYKDPMTGNMIARLRIRVVKVKR